MNLLDTQTVILAYLGSSFICLAVMAILWKQYSRRFSGLGYWLVDFLLQFIALGLTALRGAIPDFLAVTVGNTLAIGGTLLLYIGLERFTGKRGRQAHNVILLVGFFAAHATFVFIVPNPAARILLFSLALLVICAQCAWLMLRRVSPEMRSSTRGVGHVFIAFSLFSLARMAITLFVPPGTAGSANDFLGSNTYDMFVLVMYQLLSIILTFSLFLLVNNRLLADLRLDIAEREQAEQALIERMKELRCIYELSSLIHTTGTSHEDSLEEILRGSVALLPRAMQYPEFACARLVIDGQTYATEDFQDASRKLSCAVTRDGQIVGSLEICYRDALQTAGEPPFLDEEAKLLKIVAERLSLVSENWHNAEAMRKNEAIFSSFLENSPIFVFFKDKNLRSLRLSKNYEQMLGMPTQDALGKTMDELFPSDLAKSMVADDLRILNEGQRVDIIEEMNGRVYETTKFPIYKDGKPELLAGFTIDITERKRVEAALQRQNEILAALQETTLELLSQLEIDTLLEKIVQRAGQLLGTSAGYIELVDLQTGQLRPQVGLGALAESLEHVVQPGEGVAGTVWQTGKPLIVNDYDRWPGRIEGYSQSKIRSVVGVPLLSRGSVVGVLGLAHDTVSDRAFTEEDVDLLTQFAQLVTIAIENARLYQAAQQELANRSRSEAIVRLRLQLWEFSATHSTEGLMQMALDEIGAITGSPIGFYHFVEADQNTLSLQAWSTRTRAEYCKAEGEGMHYPVNEAGVWVDCVREKKPVVHNDYASLPHRKGLPEGHAALVRELVVPTLRHGKVVSILGVGNKPSDYDELDVELVDYIADIIWTIIERKRAEDQIRQLNIRLEQLAMTDELTGLENRRALFLRGADEIHRVQRYGTPLALIMLDIDRFKLINDTYGHAAGDLALQHVARILRSSIREIDIAARLGGEEFCILLPNTRAADAVKLAGRLTQAIAEEDCLFQEQKLNVTASIGVAEYNSEMLTLDALIHKADTAMYQAKDQGRNRVVYLK